MVLSSKRAVYKLCWTEFWQSSFIYKVCYFLFNGVVDLFVDSELRFEPLSLHLPTLLFQPTELLCDTAEPGRRLPCTDFAMAERGMLVKDGTKMVIVVTDRIGL